MLAIEGIQTSKFSDLFWKRGMEFLMGVKLREVRREALDNCLEVLKALEPRKPCKGLINKHSNGFLRWAFRVRGQQSVLKPNRFQRIYNKIKARSVEKVAIVATARHLAESVYWVLTRKEYYKENRAIRASSFS